MVATGAIQPSPSCEDGLSKDCAHAPASRKAMTPAKVTGKTDTAIKANGYSAGRMAAGPSGNRLAVPSANGTKRRKITMKFIF